MLFSFFPLEIIQKILNYVPCRTINNLFVNEMIPYSYINQHDNCICKSEIFDCTGNEGWYCLNGKFMDKNRGGSSSLHCIIRHDKKTNDFCTLSKLAARSSDVVCLRKLYQYGIKFVEFDLYYSIGYCNINDNIDEDKCLDCVIFICNTGCYFNFNRAIHYAKHTKNTKC